MDRIEHLVRRFLQNGAPERSILTAVRAGWLAVYPGSAVVAKLTAIIDTLPVRDCDDEGS
jgi:hypothetical protein